MTEWHVRGDYLEACNCAVLCPCLLGPRSGEAWALARPTEGYCDVPMVFQIHAGRHGAVRLDGTSVGLSIHTPGPMGEGNWTFALYLDERASPQQREAAERIFGGESGGPVGRFFGPLIGRRLPTRVVPIEYGREGGRAWGRIPGVMDLEIEGIAGLYGGPSWLDNLRHFVSSRLYTCRSQRAIYRDHGWSWDHAGRNAYYASFEWSGP
jgi:hypothetical protein